MGDFLQNEYRKALDHFYDQGAHMADSVAEGIAVAMFEVEKAPLAGDLMGPASEEARIREHGRLAQAAEEICFSCDWNLEMFMQIIEGELILLRRKKHGVCESANCDEIADGDGHWCFDCLHIEEQLEREYCGD